MSEVSARYLTMCRHICTLVPTDSLFELLDIYMNLTRCCMNTVCGITHRLGATFLK